MPDSGGLYSALAEILTRLDTDKTQKFFGAFFALDDQTIADWLSDCLLSKQVASAMWNVFSAHRQTSDVPL